MRQSESRSAHARSVSACRWAQARRSSYASSWSQGLRLCLAGTALGFAGASFLGRFLRSLLFGVSATDGLTIVVVIAMMTAVVFIATYLPATRASRIDPMLALRHD